MTEQTPEPIRLPNPMPAEPPPSEVIEVNRNTLYYAATAALFFVAGYIVAWAVFSSTTGSLLSDVKAAAAEAVATGIARIPPSSNVVAVRPTETPVPKQVIAPGNFPAWGPADAKVTIVEFSDFECPYCGLFFRDTYTQLKKDYGDKIRFVYRDFPLPQHPNAFPAALAAQCATEQNKFWEYHDVLFGNQQDLSSDGLIRYAGQIGLNVAQFTDCFKSQKYKQAVLDNAKSGEGYFVGATPTFFINGETFKGARSYKEFSAAIDALLAGAA